MHFEIQLVQKAHPCLNIAISLEQRSTSPIFFPELFLCSEALRRKLIFLTVHTQHRGKTIFEFSARPMQWRSTSPRITSHKNKVGYLVRRKQQHPAQFDPNSPYSLLFFRHGDFPGRESRRLVAKSRGGKFRAPTMTRMSPGFFCILSRFFLSFGFFGGSLYDGSCAQNRIRCGAP